MVTTRVRQKGKQIQHIIVALTFVVVVVLVMEQVNEWLNKGVSEKDNMPLEASEMI